MEKKLVDLIRLAVNLEKREVEYYKKASQKTKNPEGKKVFKYLAEEEEKHLNTLKQHLASVADKGTWLPDEQSFNKKNCKIRRKKPDKVIPKKPKPDASDLDALEEAEDIEKKSIDFYTELACRTSDKEALKVLHYIIDSEKEHLREVKIQYAFLNSEGFWYDNEVTPT